MLSREERILSELLVARNLVSRDRLEERAREQAVSPTPISLADLLVDSGDLDEGDAERLTHEAREVGRLLVPELPPGMKIGDYRLIREIGRGGMGIIYEAEQVPLGRRVALKVLPAGAALDERLAIRFLREARAVAGLRHRGIVPVYGSGQAEGVLYFAMERIDGHSLAERIEDGPLPPDEAARIASQIADALAHAHDAGLIHRDVKPENVLLDGEGQARIVDFGLVHEATAGRITLSEFVLGTPAFAAPEQLRGERVDVRCDVYGVGAVLYAMLAGRPPYAGRVPAALASRVLHDPPPRLRDIAPGVPEVLAAICERAMARDAGRRYPSARALVRDLEAHRRGEVPAFVHDSPRRGAAMLGLAAALVALVAIAWLWRGTGGAPTESPLPPAPKLGLLVGRSFELQAGPEIKSEPTLSPDATSIAYTRRDGQERHVYLQEIAQGEPSRLMEQASLASFSPDGTRLAVSSGRDQIVLLSLADRQRRQLSGAHGLSTWSPDGSRLAVIGGDGDYFYKLWVLDVDRGAGPRLLTGMGAQEPSWSPQGDRIAFVSGAGGRRDLWTIDPAGTAPVRLTDDDARDWSPAWSPDGRRLYFGSDRSGHPDLWALDLDQATGAPRGEPVPLSRGFFAAQFRVVSALRVARLAIGYGAHHTEVLFRVPFDPTARVVAGAPRRVTTSELVSARAPHSGPDGRIVFESDDEETVRLFTVDATGQSRQLTEGLQRDGGPRWSFDGSHIAFHSDREGERAIWLAESDGRNPRRLTDTAGLPVRHPVWSPDGTALVFTVEGREARWLDVRADAPPAPGRPLPVWEAPFEPWSWSSDGRRIVGTAAGAIVVYDVDRQRYDRLPARGRSPVWIGTGGDLLLARDDRILRLDGQSGRTHEVLDAGLARLGPSIHLTADGQSLEYSLAADPSGLWLIDLPANTTE